MPVLALRFGTEREGTGIQEASTLREESARIIRGSKVRDWGEALENEAPVKDLGAGLNEDVALALAERRPPREFSAVNERDITESMFRLGIGMLGDLDGLEAI